VKFTSDATTGTVNSLAVEISDLVAVFEVVSDQLNISFNYAGYPSPDTVDITAVSWSDAADCALLSDTVLSVEDVILGANFTAPITAITGASPATPTLITVTVAGGTRAKVIVDSGDKSTSVQTCNMSASLAVMSYNFTYQDTGTFDITVDAYNFVSNVTNTQTIDVYEAIDDLVLGGPTEILAPPGSSTWTVSAGANQGTLQDITCEWQMGNLFSSDFHSVSVINSSTPHQMEHAYQREDTGPQTITVNCSNAVSTQVLSKNVTVTWDNVTLGALTCNSSVFWNHTVTCQLGIVRFGTEACFEWDMGDGNAPVYYQDSSCAASVPAASPIYIQVIFLETTYS